MDQPPVSEAATFHPINRHGDELHGVSLRGIEVEGKLVDIPMQMLRAHVVIDVVVLAFQQGPKALDPVGMGHLTNKLLSNSLALWLTTSCLYPVML